MKTLKRNFFRDRDVSLPGAVGGHWARLTRLPPTDYSGLFGGHEFPRGGLPDQPIYIYRDGRDVAVSLWRAKSLMHPERRHLSFREFLRTPLDWLETPGNRQEPGIPLAEHWRRHVDRWLPLVENGSVIGVRFEHLHLDPLGTLDRLAGELGIPTRAWAPLLTPVGITPATATSGAWREHFEEADLELFFSHVPRNHPGLWSERQDRIVREGPPF